MQYLPATLSGGQTAIALEPYLLIAATLNRDQFASPISVKAAQSLELGFCFIVFNIACRKA